MGNKFCEYTRRGKVYRYKPFDTIQNMDDAYFIGYMSLAGTFKINNGNPHMGIASTNKGLIEYFSKTYCPDSKIGIRKITPSTNSEVPYEVWNLNFVNKMNETFRNFGIFCYEPQRKIRRLSKEYIPSYILGLLDANGGFYRSYMTNGKTDRIEVSLTSSSFEILRCVHNILKNCYGITSSLYDKGGYARLRLTRRESVIRFGGLIYDKVPFMYSRDKWRVFDDYAIYLITKGIPLE